MMNLGDTFVWFTGVIEDLNDDLKLGRARVRIRNLHDDDVLTEDLPWASCMLPTTSESFNGVGDTPGLAIGSPVVGFFFDGEEKQIPMIMGSFPIIPELNDDLHSLSYLSRGKQTLQKTTDGPEPPSAYAAEYPYNRVISTKSGHVIELDDTPNNERIHLYHKSGTYTEINHEGQTVHKSVGDNFEIVLKNKTMYVKGDLNIRVEGQCNIECQKVNITGDLEVTGKVIGDSVSLSDHTHGGVDTGAANTRKPNK